MREKDRKVLRNQAIIVSIVWDICHARRWSRWVRLYAGREKRRIRTRVAGPTAAFRSFDGVCVKVRDGEREHVCPDQTMPFMFLRYGKCSLFILFFFSIPLGNIN